MIMKNSSLYLRDVQTKVQLFRNDIRTSWTIMDAPLKIKKPTLEEAQMAGMAWLLSPT
jgi:hypothetical protein